MIDQQLKSAIRDVPNFPKPGIIFKDITPILRNPQLCESVVDSLVAQLPVTRIDAVAGIESRGFLFGLMLAQRLGKPFVPVRKQGKLPWRTVSQEYALEYGKAVLEIHEDAFEPGTRVLVHDDLLATGGTVTATSELIRKLGGSVAGYAFIVSLESLGGREQLYAYSKDIFSLISY
ncbi:adenine phosphoribosyltransferase [Parapedobacter deserti]|uniref:Adenine phosphoribosyltransferase n=1 Tax=Parapedobacter deserti TaxID=1912957 RepID=A0ABV7JIY1_9SPHI